MKKFLSVLAASAACASLIPAGMAMGNGRMSKQDAPKPMKGVVRILDKKASRRTLMNETLGVKALRARGINKKMGMHAKPVMSSSSSVSSSTASSTSSSTSSSASSASSESSSATSSSSGN